MAGTLTAFLRADFSLASSVVLLNGRPTEAMQIIRSVRQGCPLSPLIFILAFNTLSLLLTDVVRRRAMEGVRLIEDEDSNVQSCFADDVAIVIRAIMCYILECHRILTLFGKASGICCLWDQTKATFIPGGPPLAPFEILPWKWEVDSNATKYLGFPVAINFSTPELKEQIQLGSFRI